MNKDKEKQKYSELKNIWNVLLKSNLSLDINFLKYWT